MLGIGFFPVMNMTLDDPWDIGSLHKPSIWVFYTLSNYMGVLLCGMVMFIVARNRERSASDILVCGLSSGCLTMSITCGTQCLLNVVAGRFYGGDIACQLEAIAHISAVLTEFFCVMSISINMHLAMVHNAPIQQKTAFLLVIMIWIICIVVTGLASLFSPIYLMSAGTYCFFAFSSFAIAGWLVPGLIIALSIMMIRHVQTMQYFAKMIPEKANLPIVKLKGRQSHMTNHQDLWLGQFQWRSTLYIISVLLGWGFAAIATIYELTVGRTNEWLVTAVGVGGVSFSWISPLIFFMTSPIYKPWIVRCLSCKNAWEYHQSKSKLSTDSNSATSLEEIKTQS